MALAVPHVGGNVTTGSGTVTSDSWTSVAGSDIVVVGHVFNTAGAATNGDITDAKGNTYTLLKSLLGGASKVGVSIWHSNDTIRGASHTVTYNPTAGTTESVNIAVIEITGAQAFVNDYDSTTGATANDTATPFTVTAAGAISGNQIAVYGCTTNSTTNTAWTQPGGYTNIINQPDGNLDLQSIASYKINETGTPAPAAANAGTITDARQALVTFKEALCTRRVSTASTTNASSYASGSFTPVAGELLVAFVEHSATTADAAPTMTDSQSLGFTRVFARVADNSATVLACFVANKLAAASSMTVTFANASSTPSGAIVQVVGIAGGVSKTGATAILQSASVDKVTNGGSATTPFATFGAGATTTNVTLGAVCDLVTSPSMTPPTGWAEFDDTSYATPTTGGEYVTRDTGFTGTTITWGNTLAGRWQAGVVEIDMSPSFTALPQISVVDTAVARSTSW